VTARRPALAMLSIAALAALTMTFGSMATPSAAEDAVRVPAPTLDPADTRSSATAIFAGGCFWGVEGVFSHVRGVTRATSGYHGGSATTANYDAIGSGTTGHAESVRVTYDPRVVSYGTLLRLYFSVITDPTTLNRQGPDTGSQYRSAIIPANAAQRSVATAYIAQLARGRYWAAPIVTRVEAPQTFYPAEAYHQDFMERHPDHGYIRRWDAPKLANLRSLYPTLYVAAAAQ
jgi:peptide-methionine (S)-S-oxide reductase